MPPSDERDGVRATFQMPIVSAPSRTIITEPALADVSTNGADVNGVVAIEAYVSMLTSSSTAPIAGTAVAPSVAISRAR
jgi:hypothetical protein